MMPTTLKRKVNENTYRKYRPRNREKPQAHQSNENMIIKFENGSKNGATPNSFHKQYEHKIRHTYIPEKKIQHRKNLPPIRHQQFDFYNRRQLGNVGVSLTTEFVFAILLVIILLFVGFLVGYNFSYDTYGANSYPNSAVTNTDSKTITTGSNSSVTNTNNDADTITNTVSSG